MAIKTCVFDAYGTLFDVAAAARQAACEPDFNHISDSWPVLAENWRQKQLQYTWLRAVVGAHDDFWTITQEGLDWALEKSGHAQDAALRERLLALYWELQSYPEVPMMLARLKEAGLNTAILSNGSPDMLAGAVQSAGIDAYLDDVLSVESVAVFKPDARVYDLVLKRFGGDLGDVLFVSSNGWDAACATGYGFQTAWVNRASDPVDRLPWRPEHVLNDLRKIPEIAGI
ncbi:haloacid dehalogenase type II [Roseobacter denitrificans]|uniref:(S)-2-haloacid dehalogenase n=1 Tax=Roseobacter denitrificans (strain ATCC 33942 / OCh 114) TaxID=375451 RepID=Q161F7_ROSDO|nr:haloacid dehalogenase type II [Roseobacter denitrificans]ABG33386.1 (S)-2-haloacid dehalogenase [Roseobacter denitrificans OCh 114]AVL52709.1 haloacid dehalogenase type II [Roseobacter denitrificans]SFG23729.1 2-haloacid dehalogenase [Roseobacter denitrificans OCh 114]